MLTEAPLGYMVEWVNRLDDEARYLRRWGDLGGSATLSSDANSTLELLSQRLKSLSVTGFVEESHRVVLSFYDSGSFDPVFRIGSEFFGRVDRDQFPETYDNVDAMVEEAISYKLTNVLIDGLSHPNDNRILLNSYL